MINLVYRLKEFNKPFVYFHTLLFNMNTLNMVQSAGKSLEIDVSIGPNGELFIGHPVEFYAYKHIDLPAGNLPIDVVIELAQLAELYLVIDCKDKRALPWVEQIILAYGVERVLFHAWIDALSFKPFPAEIDVEPHWKYEDLPYDDVLALKQRTGVPVVVSTRGLTKARLASDPEIVNTIISLTVGKVEAINFNLPNGESPGKRIIKQLQLHNLLVWLNIDRVDQADLPDVFVGISDHITFVSAPNEFDQD